jgi:hypothetical protein
MAILLITESLGMEPNVFRYVPNIFLLHFVPFSYMLIFTRT